MPTFLTLMLTGVHKVADSTRLMLNINFNDRMAGRWTSLHNMGIP